MVRKTTAIKMRRSELYPFNYVWLFGLCGLKILVFSPMKNWQCIQQVNTSVQNFFSKRKLRPLIKKIFSNEKARNIVFQIANSEYAKCIHTRVFSLEFGWLQLGEYTKKKSNSLDEGRKSMSPPPQPRYKFVMSFKFVCVGSPFIPPNRTACFFYEEKLNLTRTLSNPV